MQHAQIKLQAQHVHKNSLVLSAALNTPNVIGDVVEELTTVIQVVDSNNNIQFAVLCYTHKDVLQFINWTSVNICASITAQQVLDAAHAVKQHTALARRAMFAAAHKLHTV